MRPSMAASPPNRYGTGECHGEAGSAAAAAAGGIAAGDVVDVDVGLETLVAGLMPSTSSDRGERSEAGCVCGDWQFLASRERERDHRCLGVGEMTKWRVRLMRGIYRRFGVGIFLRLCSKRGRYLSGT